MEHASHGHVRPADFSHVIEQQIHQRTYGRIHNLRVEMTCERVVIHGRVATYYLRQLALQAALSVSGELQVCVENLHVV